MCNMLEFITGERRIFTNILKLFVCVYTSVLGASIFRNSFLFNGFGLSFA